MPNSTAPQPHPSAPQDGTAADAEQPITRLRLSATDVTLLGTAHVSKASADKVHELLESGEFDAVAVELCPSRYNALLNPDALAKMDLLSALRGGKAPMIIANLALGAYQQRIAEDLDIEPGAEMRMAVSQARDKHLPVLLVDREIGTTLKRIYRSLPFVRRLSLFNGLLVSAFTQERVSAEDIERLKEGDILETAFSEFAAEATDLFIPLIDERDAYMAARIRQEVAANAPKHLLVVVGAGHLAGISRHLKDDPPEPVARTIAELDMVPAGSRWFKFIPWVIVALIIAGFIVGFSHSPEFGWKLIAEWIVINGGLAALGALIAIAHPLTIVVAFLAAPLTSLNPTISAGMVTGATELVLRKPAVGDFLSLRHDAAHLKGWWSNRVARILLIFLLSTFGSALGTYIAGILIFEQISAH